MQNKTKTKNDASPKGREADLLETARKRYHYCLSAETSRALQKEDLRFYAGSPDNGWQWPEKVKAARENDPAGARPCLTVNKVPEHVRQVTNEQRQNRPAIKVLPVDDKSDPELAEKLTGLCRHIENVSDADIAYDTACEQQVIHGEGFWRIVTEYVDDDSFDQEIYIRRIRNSFHVHVDPDIQDATGMDARFGFIDEMLTEEEFEQKYPDAKPVDWDEAGEIPEWYDSGEKKIRIAEYFHVENEPAELYLWSDGSTGFDVPGNVSIIEQPVRTRKVNRRRVKWCKLTGSEVLDERDWAGKWIPIIRVIGNELDVDGRIEISGMVRNIKDPARMYNYWVSQEAEVLALAPKAPFVVAEGQLEGYEKQWAEANVKNLAYLTYKPVTEDGTLLPAPQRQLPPMMPAAFLQAKAGASDDIKSVTGQYDPSLGQRSNETSGKAIIARKTVGDTSNFHYIDNLSRAIRFTARQLVDLIPKIYDSRRVARILGEDGEPDQIMIDPRIPTAVQPVMALDPRQGKEVEIGRLYNPTIGKYDVVVTAGPSFSTRRQEAAQAMVQMTQANPQLWQVIGDLMVKNMDWPGAQDMADRMKSILLPELRAADNQQPMPPEALAAVNQARQMAQAVAQKEQELQGLEAGISQEKAALDAARAQLAAEKRVLDAGYKRIQAELRADRAEATCKQMMDQAAMMNRQPEMTM